MTTVGTPIPASDIGSLHATSVRILRAIAAHIDEHGYSPTVRELGRYVGLSSTSTVYGHLLRLEAAGWVVNVGGRRTIRLARPLP